MEEILKKGQEVLVTIKRIGINGEGIGYYKKLAVFVDGVMPPEQVVLRVTDVKMGYCKGEIVRVKVKSPNRIKPFCKHYAVCGGCQLQHMAYHEQLKQKTEMLRQTLERYTTLDLAKLQINKIIGVENNKNYRNKAQMPVRNTPSGIITGLYKKESNDLVDITDCPVQNEEINRVNQAVLDICDTYEINAFDFTTMRGLLRYIVTRVSSLNGDIQVTLVVTIFNSALKDAAKEIIKIPGVKSVFISKNKDVKNVEIFGEEVELLEGTPTITEGIGNILYSLKPKAFYQLNPLQAVKLYDEVKRHLDFSVDKVMVDAYAGSGAISMYLSPFFEKIVAIDISKESVYSGIHNIKINHLKNVEFELGSVKEVLTAQFDKGLKPDVIIFDPPRSGLDEETIDLLLRKPVKKLIYVSCNPSTLAKNIKMLSKKYNVIEVTPVDMFPHTSHVESITLLSLKTAS